MSQSPNPLLQVYQQLTRRMLVVFALLSPLCLFAGWLWKAMPGLWGALVALIVALFFSGSTVVLGRFTVNMPINQATYWLMGSYLLKLVVLFFAFVILKKFTFYSSHVFLAMLFVSIAALFTLEIFTFTRAKVPYVDPVSPTRDMHMPLD